MAPFVNVVADMPRSRRSSTVTVPDPVARWLCAMSVRVGAPAHRVLRVLLDQYAKQLPDRLRQRLREPDVARGGRERPH